MNTILGPTGLRYIACFQLNNIVVPTLVVNGVYKTNNGLLLPLLPGWHTTWQVLQFLPPMKTYKCIAFGFQDLDISSAKFSRFSFQDCGILDAKFSRSPSRFGKILTNKFSRISLQDWVPSFLGSPSRIGYHVFQDLPSGLGHIECEVFQVLPPGLGHTGCQVFQVLLSGLGYIGCQAFQDLPPGLGILDATFSRTKGRQVGKFSAHAV